jgi:hypothetical protein
VNKKLYSSIAALVDAQIDTIRNNKKVINENI